MRKRCTWETVERHNNYEFQKNEYDERRIKFHGKVFMTFHRAFAQKDARKMFEIIKEF